MNTVLVIIQSILIIMFGISVSVKFLRTQSMVQHWTSYRYPFWFMNVTALLEFVGVCTLITAFWLPELSIFAGTLLALLMLGAIQAHLVRAKHKPSMAIHAIVMLVLSVSLIFL
ncbi:DoxX family protein [Paenibacillus sp. SYP-B3998]|uniref:DoxX family protein n=1 Tax=Paenibacillus sp. SYP-B3998 TaxID=2678564 RepID=A0A6G3ZX65_9BACL|nr:DoxX family protein [Paenibacillus sp. SYP-B3998]NEW06705.1 DoxX family protein [Paenibacillus sp. SYP-B3998]